MQAFQRIIAGGQTKEQLLRNLKDAGTRFNAYAEILFRHRDFSLDPDSTKDSLELVKVTLAGLGLSQTCSFQTVVSRAADLGLGLCPLYLAAFLRLEYLDQPEGIDLTIVSKRPEGDESFPTGFYLRNRDGSLWLRGYRVEGAAEWPVNIEFVFLAPLIACNPSR